jgi:hypothetical protein
VSASSATFFDGDVSVTLFDVTFSYKWSSNLLLCDVDFETDCQRSDKPFLLRHSPSNKLERLSVSSIFSLAYYLRFRNRV